MLPPPISGCRFFTPPCRLPRFAASLFVLFSYADVATFLLMFAAVGDMLFAISMRDIIAVSIF